MAMARAPSSKAATSPTIARGPLASSTNMAIPAARPPPPPQQPAYVPQQPAYELPPQRRFIAPPSQASSQQRQQRAERLKALMRPGVLQLRDVDITLYEAAPLTPYELYVRHQSRNVHSKSSQTHEDDVEVAIQTDEIETDEQGCQCPEDLGRAGRNRNYEASESAKTASALTANVPRLNRFLRSASRVIEADDLMYVHRRHETNASAPHRKDMWQGVMPLQLAGAEAMAAPALVTRLLEQHTQPLLVDADAA